MDTSSVSPDLAETTVPKPASRASSKHRTASVTVPIWLTLMRTAFAAVSDRVGCQLRAGDKIVVADDLDPVAEAAGKFDHALAVILRKRVLDRGDRIGADPVAEKVDQSFGGKGALI